METFFGFDEESVDSETLSETSCNTDRTDRAPATPEEDLDDVSRPHPGDACTAPPASGRCRHCSLTVRHEPCRTCVIVVQHPGKVVPTVTGSENGDGGAGSTWGPLPSPARLSHRRSVATALLLTLCH